MGDLNKNKIVERENEIEQLVIYKSEKRGVYTVLALYLISWGMIITPWGVMRLVGWVSLGLIGLSLWRIMEGLFDRIKKKEAKK